MIMDSMYKDM